MACRWKPGNFGVKLTMPTTSVLLLLATGVKSHQLVVAAAAGLAICLVAGVVIGLVLWKERVASALGRIVDRAATWFLRPFRKGPVSSLEPAMVAIRQQTIDVARSSHARAARLPVPVVRGADWAFHRFDARLGTCSVVPW
jgi:hypothetical protein